MNRKLLFFCVLTLPVFLVVVVAQTIQYQNLEKSVKEKEKAQYEWVEKNKKTMTGITVLSSPDRIESVARDQLKLEPAGDKQIRLKFTGP